MLNAQRDWSMRCLKTYALSGPAPGCGGPMQGCTSAMSIDPRRLDSTAAGSPSGLPPSAAASAKLGASGSATGSGTGDATTPLRNGGTAEAPMAGASCTNPPN
jgi:hypothetical protein